MNRSMMVLFMTTAFSSALHAEPLPQVVQGLLQSSPDILIESANRKASDYAVGQAKAGYFPQIDLSAGAGREYLKDLATRNAYSGSGKSYNRQDAEVQLVQMLFDGNGVGSEVARQRARQLGAAHRLASTSEDIALKTTEAYLDVLLAQEVLKLTQDNLATHESTAEQVKLRTAGGFGRKSDDEQINARVALAKANLAAAQSALNEAKIAFIRFVGTEPENLTLPEQPTGVPQSAAEAADWAVANNQALQAAKADVQGAQAQLGLAKSQMYPRLNLEAGAAYSNALDGISVEETTRVWDVARALFIQEWRR